MDHTCGFEESTGTKFVKFKWMEWWCMMYVPLAILDSILIVNPKEMWTSINSPTLIWLLQQLCWILYTIFFILKTVSRDKSVILTIQYKRMITPVALWVKVSLFSTPKVCILWSVPIIRYRAVTCALESCQTPIQINKNNKWNYNYFTSIYQKS